VDANTATVRPVGSFRPGSAVVVGPGSVVVVVVVSGATVVVVSGAGVVGGAVSAVV
jgi:hypothetical protein